LRILFTSYFTHTLNIVLQQQKKMNLDTIMNNSIEAAVTTALRTRDAKIVRLEESINDLRRIIDTHLGKSRMLKDKVAGLTTANELMKQEMEAIKFRAEQKSDSTSEKVVLKRMADALYAAVESNDDLDTFDMDSQMEDLFSTGTVTSNTQPVVVAAKKETGSPKRKKPRTSPVATITIGVKDPRRRLVVQKAEEISDFTDDEEDDRLAIQELYSDDCPQTNLFGTYIHEYRPGGRRPNCTQCTKRPTLIKVKDSVFGFYHCAECKLRYHKFVRTDGNRPRQSQQWFSTAR